MGISGIRGLTVVGLGLALTGCGGGLGPAVTSTVTVTESATHSDTKAEATWTMPNEIGKDLQRAQDDLQELTGNPLFFSGSDDLTGRGRHQINDRNWQVCSSTPPPGATFTAHTDVVFGVVRDSENCP